MDEAADQGPEPGHPEGSPGSEAPETTDGSEVSEDPGNGWHTGPDLLATPEYDAAVERFFWDAVELTASHVDPVYAHVSKHSINPNVEAVSVEIAGKTVESPMVPVQYEFVIEYADIRDTNLEALKIVIHSAAMSKLEQVSAAYSEYMDDATDAVGNNVRLDKDTFTWDTVLDLLEKVEWSEGTDGRVHAPRQYSGAKVPRLPDMTPEQQLRMKQIDAKKQEEYVARRRSRRLR